VLNLKAPVSIHDDFFNDLGGDSLTAAMLVSKLREEMSTASVTVRDVYEKRTLAAFTRSLRPLRPGVEISPDETEHGGRPILATCIQAAWLLTLLLLGGLLTYAVAFKAFPLVIRTLGLLPFLLIAPAIILVASWFYTALALIIAVVVKRVLIGRYQPMRATVWGGFHTRNWMVLQVVRLVPWSILEGTVFQQIALRALGARIGCRVHIHHGVNLLQGGWDLLEIGDDVTVSQDASIHLVDLDDGHLVVGSVTLGDGATLEVRAGLGANTVLEPGAVLSNLSYLPQGKKIPCNERWSGVPAEPAGQAAPPSPLQKDERILSPIKHGVALILARAALQAVQALPLPLLLLCFAIANDLDAERVLEWIFNSHRNVAPLMVGVLLVIVSGPITLLLQSILLKIMGPVSQGVISRWSIAYIRVWLKSSLVQSAGNRLSGTLFWPPWLRLTGMKIGSGCEISTIIDTIPELVEIGEESFLADGIYLGGPQIHQGVVSLALTVLGRNTFIGNHAVIPCGQRLPDDLLLGICTVADSAFIRAGTSWFGIPPFELPRREIIECDRCLTHDPSLIRYVNRLLWEGLRFLLPFAPVVIFLTWLSVVAAFERIAPSPVLLFVLVPLATLGAALCICSLALLFKWGLLGRVRPGMHPLWSCWCSRWDFFYVAWGAYARGLLTSLEGTLLLNWVLRAMGAKVGGRVYLGGGFAQVVDPDMLVFHERSTVNTMFQAHSFEDRVLKIDRITIRKRATVRSASVLMYGADIGVRTRVIPHSVVMKHERLIEGMCYEGAPTRLSEVPCDSKVDRMQDQK